MQHIDVNESTKFTGWRSVFFPVHNHELKKFLPLAVLIFCLTLSTVILRSTKDSLLFYTIPNAIQTLIMIKTYVVTPAIILFICLYAKLVNVFSQQKLFYVILSPFLIFFFVFGLIVCPLNLCVDRFAKLFYAVAEVWEVFMVTLIFWQFSNHIVRMDEAKRFYPMFVVIGSIAGIVAWPTEVFCSENIAKMVSNKPSWQIAVSLLMVAVFIMGIVAIMVYRWMYQNVLNDRAYFDLENSSVSEQPGFWESLKIIIKSPVLWLIFVSVVAISTSINLVEMQWKNQLKIFCASDKALFNYYMGLFATVTGICTIVFGLTVSAYILRKASWGKAAMITPLVALIAGSIFFGLIISSEKLDVFFGLFGTKTTAAIVMFGFGFIAVLKAFKYTLFGTTKEMAYIPLDNVLKTKGKAITDLISWRIGFAFGPIIQSTLLISFATKDVAAIALMLFLIFVGIAICWIFAVKALSLKITVAESHR